MLMSSYDLLANGPSGTSVTPEELPVEMSGVLCRCTGYRGILAAVADVAAAYPDGVPEPGNRATRTMLGRGGSRPGVAPEPVGETGSAAGGGRVEPPAEVRLPSGAPSATVEVRSELSAPVDAVWRVLDDFEQLARCLPGASLVEILDGGRYRGRAVVALGPVKLSFEGLAQVVERDVDGHRLRVHAQGADAGGSATQADIQLLVSPASGGGSVLSADAGLFLSGRIAQFGRALAGDVSRRMFEQFASAVDQAATTGTAPEVGAGPSPVRIVLGVLLARLRRLFARRR
jgi:carbon-monoxide dehydrogenase small subunit